MPVSRGPHRRAFALGGTGAHGPRVVRSRNGRPRVTPWWRVVCIRVSSPTADSEIGRGSIMSKHKPHRGPGPTIVHGEPGQPHAVNQGEGDRIAARTYERHLHEYVGSGKVEAAARDAERAVDG